MIDRDARDKAAEVLRRFVSGKITNHEFENGEIVASDRAIKAIWGTAWCFYDDLKVHRLTGGHRLCPTQRREVLRWISFLDSDYEYVWPDISVPGADPLRRVRVGAKYLGFLMSGGALSAEKARQFLAAGDYQAWPFASRAQYKEALRQPRRLTGKLRQARTALHGPGAGETHHFIA
jgi:hypothetical protein